MAEDINDMLSSVPPPPPPKAPPAEKDLMKMAPGARKDEAMRRISTLIQVTSINQEEEKARAFKLKGLQYIIDQAGKEESETVSQGLDMIVKILDFYRNQYIPSARMTFDKTFKNLKKEIAFKMVTFLWDKAVDKSIVQENDDLLKDEINRQAELFADGLGKEFSLEDVYCEVNIKFAQVQEGIDRYLARNNKLKLVGNVGKAAVDTNASATAGKGGAQYRAEKKALERDGRKREF